MNYTLSGVRINSRLLSFTESKDALLMWAHYANEHKGFVVGFNMFDLAFDYQHSDSGIFSNLFQPPKLGEHFTFDGSATAVMYRKQPRYRVDSLDFDYSGYCSWQGGGRFLYDIFLQKSDEWLYEKEHRVILRLEQADKVIVFDIDKIKNTAIKKSIVELEWCKSKQNENNQQYYEIDLFKITETTDKLDKEDVEYNRYQRERIAIELAKLSDNPSNIYLFQLKPGAFTHCLLGLENTQDWQDIAIDYARSPGFFEFWQVTRHQSDYALDFKELCRLL